MTDEIRPLPAGRVRLPDDRRACRRCGQAHRGAVHPGGHVDAYICSDCARELRRGETTHRRCERLWPGGRWMVAS